MHAMDDVAGPPIYDGETAIHFIHETTGIDVELCRGIIEVRDEFALGMGIYPADEDELVTLRDALRKGWPVFFQPDSIRERYVDANLELAFIVLKGKFDADDVRRALAADEEYMRRLGIIVDVV